jgi:hypothetical protein
MIKKTNIPLRNKNNCKKLLRGTVTLENASGYDDFIFRKLIKFADLNIYTCGSIFLRTVSAYAI